MGLVVGLWVLSLIPEECVSPYFPFSLYILAQLAEAKHKSFFAFTVSREI